MKKIFFISVIISLLYGCTKDPIPNEYAAVPKVTTQATSYITYTSVTLSISINSQNASKIGIFYGKNSSPNQRNFTLATTSLYETSFTLNNLNYGTKYYYRAFATNDIDTVYGEIKSFTTTNATKPIVSTTTEISYITQNSAYSGGNVSSDGGFSVTVKGVCWSTAANPTIINDKTMDDYDIGSYYSYMTRLTAGTTYYVRAYATNTLGTSYGPQVSFVTSPVLLPTLSTSSTVTTSQSTATCGGNVYTDGGGTITARGVCWGTSANPTIALTTKTTDGTGTGVFTSSITGLLENTTYYVRAYATNSAGTAYGAQVNITIAPIVIPTITTSSVVATSQTSVSCGGSISNTGGGAITSRGVCWSTSSNPTITLATKTSNGTGSGSFSSSITELSENTTYYVRAYATNSAGTAYGANVSFFTSVMIGQSYQGGIVAYILKSGDSGYIAGQTHGLIAAPSDQSAGIKWYNGSYITTGATGTAIGTGLANTNAIVAYQGAGSYAAKICYDLVLNGYSDWYLPSKDELIQLYYNQGVIGGFINGAWYWSSSETSYNSAWELLLSTSSIGSYSKSFEDYVRAIRSF